MQKLVKFGPEPQKDNTILFNINDEPVLELRPNGDFIVKGKKVVNDMEVYKAFKEFIEFHKVT